MIKDGRVRVGVAEHRGQPITAVKAEGAHRDQLEGGSPPRVASFLQCEGPQTTTNMHQGWS